jgi:hypothetical protein
MKKKVVADNQTLIKEEDAAEIAKPQKNVFWLGSLQYPQVRNILEFEEEFNWGIDQFEHALKLALRLKEMAFKARDEAVKNLKEERKKNDLLEEQIDELRQKLAEKDIRNETEINSTI